MRKLRIIVAGSRSFEDYALLEKELDFFLNENTDAETSVSIISGGAKGADRLGERYAREHGIDLVICPANWGKYGRGAGPVRNEKMLEIAAETGYTGILIAFWDSNSPGTENMIELSKNRGLEVHIVKI